MRRRLGWLLAALLLFAAAAWLMLRGEDEQKVSTAKDRVSMPKRLDAEDRERAQQRRTWAPPLPADAGAPTFAQLRPRDPLHSAIFAQKGDSALVLEANAIRHSKIGDLLVACLNRRGQLDKLSQNTGIDATRDLDRVAAFDGAIIFSGNFEKARFDDAPFAKFSSQYGDATFFRGGPNGVITLRDGGTHLDPRVVVKWKDQLIAFADDEEAAKKIVDRLEGRAPVEETVLDESLAYGEIYGVLSAKDVAEMLPDDQQALKDTLQAAAARIELHADTMSDVGIVADVQGPDADKVKDLGKSLGAALAVSRLQASAEGKDDLVELLDLAKVVTQDGQFRVEFALPMEMLEKRLAFCREGADGG